MQILPEATQECFVSMLCRQKGTCRSSMLSCGQLGMMQVNVTFQCGL